MALGLRIVGEEYESPWSRNPSLTTRPGEEIVDEVGRGVFIYTLARTQQVARKFSPGQGRRLLVVEFDEEDIVPGSMPCAVRRLRVLREVEPDEAARLASGATLVET